MKNITLRSFSISFLLRLIFPAETLTAQNFTVDLHQFRMEVKTEDDAYLNFVAESYGRNATLCDLKGEAVTNSIKNATYTRVEAAGFSAEYFCNDDRLRSNYILHNKPDGYGELIFSIAIETNFEIESHYDRIIFTSPDNENFAFEYSDFKVWDANGSLLPFEIVLNKDENSNKLSLHFYINDNDACYPVVIDPLFRSLVLTMIQSSDTGSQLGFSCAFADVNGDGFDDVIAGAPYYDPGASGDNGACNVYLSGSKGVASTPVFQLSSSEAGAYLGWSVSNAGDINDDGYEDVIVSAPLSNYYDGTNHYNSGKVFILYGSADGINTTATDTLVPPAPDYGAQFGYSIAGLGDVNGDEYGDILISSYYFWGGTGTVGKVYLFYGSSFGISSSPAWSFTSNENASGFGFTVKKAGDINSDGYNDFLIGSPFASHDSSYNGAAYLFYGSSTIPDNWPAAVLNGTVNDAGFGFALEGGMDVNNDNYSDFTISSPVESGVLLECHGMIRNYLGSASGPVLHSGLRGDFEKSGTRVINAGDFNGDGFSDMLYSSSNFTGFYGECESGDEGSSLYLGSSTGLDTMPAWKNNLYELHSIGYGSSLAGDGDINLDGFDDYIVGVGGYDFPTSNAGAIFIYYGSPTLNYINDVADSADTFKNKILSSSYFWEVASTFESDLDNNGYNDLVLGSTNYPGGYGSPGGVAFHMNYGPGIGIQTNPSFTYEGVVEFQNLGNAVASLGDYNNDGYDDVAVASQDYNDRGAVYIFNGNATGVNHVPTILYGSLIAYTASFGFKMIAEDINADGIKDLIVADNFYNQLSYKQGAVFIFLGSLSGYSNTPSFTLTGQVYMEELGLWLSKAGDVNNDGYMDIIVSSAYNSTAPGYHGGIKLFTGSASGINTTPLSNIQGTSYAQYLGQVAWQAGDVNGDDFDDILIIDRSQSEQFMGDGEVRLFFGSSTGLNENNFWRAKGGQEDAMIGSCFAGPADFNGDGYGDLAIGASGYHGDDDDNNNTSGGIYMYYGTYDGVTMPNKIYEADSNKTVQNLGLRLFAAADFTGDGIPELAAMSPSADPNSIDVLYFSSSHSSCTMISSIDPFPLANSITLLWSGAETDYHYTIKWKSDLDSIWNDTTIINQEINFNELEPCRGYLFLLQKNCEDGSSAWTDTLIVQTTGCEIPCSMIEITGVSSSLVTTTSAHIDWEAAVEAVSYEIHYKPSTDIIWTSTSTTENSIDLNTLSSCIAYDYKIRPICATDSGNFTMIFNFTTLCPACTYAPAFLNISNITTTSAKAIYGSVDGATKYKIWYRAAGGAWKKVTAPGTAKTLKNLVPNTTYNVKVQAICGLTAGPFTPITSFITLPLKSGIDNNNMIEPEVMATELKVSPNPSKGVFHIGFDKSMNNAEYGLTLFNSSGQAVYIQNGTMYYSIQIETTLPTGIYFINLNVNGILYQQKIMIVK